MIYDVREGMEQMRLAQGRLYEDGNEPSVPKKWGQLLDLVCKGFLLNRNCFTRFCVNGFELVYYNMKGELVCQSAGTPSIDYTGLPCLDTSPTQRPQQGTVHL